MNPAKILFKDGVVGPPTGPIAFALDVLAKVWGWFGRKELVVTALRDGTHMEHSLHPRGYAVDIRTNDIPPAHVRAMTAAARKMLPAFDIALESGNTPGASAAHLHAEWDPEGNGGANLPDLTEAVPAKPVS